METKKETLNFTYAIQVMTGKEIKTKQKIEYLLDTSDNSIIYNEVNILVPLIEGRKKKQVPLLPGYIIVRLSKEMPACFWHLLKKAGVVRILGHCFCYEEIEAMLIRIQQHRKNCKKLLQRINLKRTTNLAINKINDKLLKLISVSEANILERVKKPRVIPLLN